MHPPRACQSPQPQMHRQTAHATRRIVHSVLFSSSAVLDPRVGHTMDVFTVLFHYKVVAKTE